MNSLPSIALSGLQAASLQSRVAAHNVANVQTPAFRRQTVQQTAMAEGGVSARVDRVEDTVPTSPAAEQVADVYGSWGSVAEDMVQQMAATYAFKANLRMVLAHQRMLGTWLDERA